ncbi:MAG: hypothetical protein ACPG8W_21085 [Candidatus Promineifilaceae bacterium]
MADENNSQSQEFAALYQRLEWFDGERRQTNIKLAELERKLEHQARELETRDQRIESLETQLTRQRRRNTDIPDVNFQLEQLRKELVGLIDKAEGRRQDSEREIERLRRVEREITNRELTDIRTELPHLPRIQNALDQRRAEEGRLAQMIGGVQNRFPSIDSRLDALGSAVAYLEESLKQYARESSQLPPQIMALGKQIDDLDERLRLTSLTASRFENTVNQTAQSQSGIERKVKDWFEQIRISEYDRNKRVEAWQTAFGAYKDDMQRFQAQWLRFSDQAKESKGAVQAIAGWRKEIERQLREQSELNRVEVQRMGNRWQEFQNTNDKFWKNIEVEQLQRRAAGDRRQKELLVLLQDLETQITGLKTQKETLWRIQTAQSDAIKKIPTLWLEEVEKAIANDPNRRRAATSTPTPNEF